MLDDVAVPDVKAFDVELCLDLGNVTRVGDYRVLEASLPGLNHVKPGRCRVCEFGPADYLEPNKVQVDGMRVYREVVDVPFLDAVKGGILRDVDNRRIVVI